MTGKKNQSWVWYRTGVVLFILLLGLCMAKVSFAQGAGNGLEVRFVGPEPIEAEPQKAVTVVFQVTNTTEQTRKFIGEVALPDEFWLISKEVPFELGPAESSIQLVGFSAPLKVLAGHYQITYTVRDQEIPSISDECTVEVVVLPLARLEVKLMEAPQYIIAGKSYEASFVVINASNTASAVILEIESERNYSAKADINKFHLGPGESQNVTITVETSPDISQRIEHRLKLTATALDIEGGVASATSLVEIIPRLTGLSREDIFHILPGKLTLSTILEKSEAVTFGLQIELSGSGALDEEGTTEFAFFSRGPSIRQELFSQPQDEQYLSYRTKRGEIYLGDANYFLSPLTERGYYGRGLEGRLNLGALSLKAYSQESRFWSRPRLEETAVRASWQLEEKFEVALNYLKKKETDPPEDFSGELADHYIWSLQARLGSPDKIGFDLEYAWSQKKEEIENFDDAYWLKVDGRYQGIYYRGEVAHAGPHYAGFYSDIDLKSGDLVFFLGKNLELNAYYSKQRKNLELNPTLSSALYEEYFQLGLKHKFTPITGLSLEYRKENREDCLSLPPLNYQEESLGLRMEQNFGKLNFYGLAELGRSRDNLTGQSQNLERYKASLIYQPTSKQYYSGYYQMDDTYEFAGNHQYRIVRGFNARLEVSDRTSFDANYRLSEDWESFRQESMEIILRRGLSDGYGFALRIRHTLEGYSDYDARTTYFFEYTTPLQIPIGYKTNIGVLKGRVYDFENEEQGIADVVLRADGATAATDENGNFIFPSLKSGTYHIWVDKTSIGMDRTTVPKTPMEVSVEGGKETLLNLGIVRSASLSGRVVVYDYEVTLGITAPAEGEESEQRKLVESYGLAGTLVELTNKSDVRRRVTDNKGSFYFEDLPPGLWTLKVYKDNLPEFYYLEKDTFEFELKAGDKKEIGVRVLPQLRVIRVMEGGGEIFLEEE